jgi:rieske iron-sulfur protein
MIEIGESSVVETDFDFSQIKSMRPNSVEYFYYPNPEDTENRDAFQKFILIRLPGELGGDKDDVSAFRAYSALSLSDHCLIKYWPDTGRQRMENPCWGDFYRAIDGVMMSGVDSGRVAFSPNALPYLELSTDENGSLFVEPPVWTLDENGVIGVGRHVSMEQVREISQLLVNSVMESNSNYPKIPVTFSAYTLTQIHFTHGLDAMYLDFSPVSDYVYFTVDNVSAQDQKNFQNITLSNSEVWQIGEIPIKIDGSGFEKNNSTPYFKQYKVKFILDGFTFTIEGKDLELIKRGIVANFFPEYSFDDLVLVSSMEKK